MIQIVNGLLAVVLAVLAVVVTGGALVADEGDAVGAAAAI